MDERTKELEAEVDELSDQLAGHFYQTIQILSAIVSVQDVYYEGSHSRFVSQKSAEVAKALDLSDIEVYEIKIAGLLHDIGKVGFKESLMTKFTSEMKANEYSQYSLHPEFGMQILKKHQGFDSVTTIVQQHHEKIDGSGFPRHLQGKEICPGAAIIAVVDSYHNSVFKKQKDTGSSTKYTSTIAFLDSSKSRFAAAMNYLHSKAGVIFDRKVVKVFTDIIEEERRQLGYKTVLRLPVNKVEPGMVFAEDCITTYGLVIGSSGESVSEDMMPVLIDSARWREIPQKILVMR